ncbi:MAG: aminotransferase class IV [Pseudomonadota bacterium]
MATYLERFVYINGEYVRGADARISIFDRGLLFADAAYEGLGVLDGRVVDKEMHLARLEASLTKLAIPSPMTNAQFAHVFDRLIHLNEMFEGFLYLQISRGEADRDYVYRSDLTPNVFAFVQPHLQPVAEHTPNGVAMQSHPDLRWKRRDIKTTNLLGQVIAKTAADSAGAYEALMIDEAGQITEGGATSFFIVTEGTVIARPVDNSILHGITRQTMLRVADELGYSVEYRKITLDEALAADEAFITGASSYIEPVVQIDGAAIGEGAPGPYTLALRARYLETVRAGPAP